MTQNTLYSVPSLVENLLEIAQNADTKNYAVALTVFYINHFYKNAPS